MARIFRPLAVPPGSCVSTTSLPIERSRSARIRICVVLPEPSGPSNVRKVPFGSVIDVVKGLFQVFPRLPLSVLIVRAEQVRRMVSDHYRDVPPLVPIAAQSRNALFCPEQCLGRC